MESQKKIEDKLNELNKGIITKPWIAVAGFNMMPEAKVSQGTLKFETNTGYTVKVFVDTRTGEIKLFPAILFTD